MPNDFLTRHLRRIGLVVVLVAAVAWSYWPAIAAAISRWSSDPQYSHGYLVPLFSIYLLWLRRGLRTGAVRGAWLGFLALGVGAVMRWFGTRYFFNGLDLLALLPSLMGVALVAGGVGALRWAWPAILFLIFMVPLPYRMQTAMSGELQRVATGMSTYILQTVGMPAVAEGNVIILDDVRLGVVDACSGLGMIVTFAAMSAGVALIIRSEWWVKVGVLLGAIPLAVVSNVARITVTGVLYQAGFAEVGEAVFHDLAGWLMMPLASVILIGEVYVLDRLVIDAPPIADRIVRIDGAAAPA